MRRERDLRGWSQEDVADKLGTSAVNISRWERGITFPSSYYRQRLCLLFEKDAAQLDLLCAPISSVSAANEASKSRNVNQQPFHQPCNLDFSENLFGWSLSGNARLRYEYAIDHVVKQSGQVSACLKSSTAEPEEFGVIAQIVAADAYRGKQLCLRGSIQAEAVEEWCGLWLRVDGPQQLLHSFDNMEDRPVHGTTGWTRYEIVLPVFLDSVNIVFGMLLVGRGQVWLDKMELACISE